MENPHDVSSHDHREKRQDPTVLIDNMIQRINNLDLNISIALGHILSEKIKHESSEGDDELCERKDEKKDVGGLSSETIFKKLNEVERKLSDALR